MAGQPHDLMLRVHGAQPTEDDVAAWMSEGSVIRLEVTETANRAPHTMLVNFGGVVFAWIVPFKSGQ
ncbi:hypothetical protein [Sphaerisporangium perillae]|uniref:hypothetical protein n=1 Tax=Sphaerisporangium perillae TaxID=2935860 RepID=UPI00200BA1DD|nr:hypothetical protein [Sphaerisporangium perillae]